MKVVLAGGPCTGKSTLVQELASRGYETVPEAARSVIEPLKGGMFFMCPFNSAVFADLQKQIVCKQIELESKISGKGMVFFDRSALDSLAYLRFYDVRAPDELKNYASNSKFDYVFILDRVKDVEYDGVRFEKPAESIVIHGLISQIYEELGYKIIRVPVMPVKERADFILKHIGGENGS